LYLYKVGPTFHQGPRFSKGIDNISMPKYTSRYAAAFRTTEKRASILL
jgi:hypothetical protein